MRHLMLSAPTSYGSVAILDVERQVLKFSSFIVAPLSLSSVSLLAFMAKFIPFSALGLQM
jgi:hypothetical protein